MCFATVDMDKRDDAIVTSVAAMDVQHDVDTACEKPTSKRQLKLQKRREEWLSRKAERR